MSSGRIFPPALLENKQEKRSYSWMSKFGELSSQPCVRYARLYNSQRKQGVEHSFLRTASQQCLSAMTWYMKDHWYILSNSDEVTTILQFMEVSLLVNTYEESIGRRTWRWR